MELFNRFNRKNIDDRQIDTLIGLSKGLTADGAISQGEAEFLLTWLIQNRAASKNPIIGNLLSKVSSILADGALDTDEASELLLTLRGITGEQSEIGELAKPSTLPVNHPPEPIIFPERSFVLTGTFAFGTRKQCQEAVESLGGINANGVTKSLHYLVIGSYVTDSWAHETFGRKIQKAVEYQSGGVPLIIVTEEHWANEGRLRV
jgi:NAD-dependent DNA ligase